MSLIKSALLLPALCFYLFSCFSSSAQSLQTRSNSLVKYSDTPGACFEAEKSAHSGAVQIYPESVVMQAEAKLRIPFTMQNDGLINVWLRVRAPTQAHNKIRLGIDAVPTADAEIWDIPVTPILRWQRAALRGASGTFYRADNQAWPNRLRTGVHTLHIVGHAPDVEIDAVCVDSNKDLAPQEPFKQAPKRQLTHILKNYGAIGNGIADDTDALQGALAALKPGDALSIPLGRYRFTKPLHLNTDNVSVIGSGAGSVLFADFPLEPVSSAAISIASNINSSNKTPLISSAPMLARELLIDVNSPLKAGDIVMVSSNEWGPPAPNLKTLFHRNRANIVHVIDARLEGENKRLILDRPLLGAFSTENGAAVEQFHPITGVVFSRLAIEGTNKPIAADNADMSLITAQRCNNCFFSDLELSHARIAGIQFLHSLDSQVIKVHVFDVTDTSGGGHGYGVVINRSQGIVVRDSLFDGVLRHGVPISWGSVETFVFKNRFDRRTAHENNIQSIDIHGQDDYANLVEQNTIIGGSMGIVVGGGGSTHGNDGPWNVIRNNVIVNTDDGIGVFKQTHNTIIDGNSLLHIKKRAIRIESGSDSAQIWNNRIDDYGAVGININNSSDGSIYKNTISNGAKEQKAAIKLINSRGYRIEENVP